MGMNDEYGLWGYKLLVINTRIGGITCINICLGLYEISRFGYPVGLLMSICILCYMTLEE